MQQLHAWTSKNGNVPMLQFAGGPTRPALRLVLLHDDADREFDYTAGAEQAKQQNWTVISMKGDWSTVFADVPKEEQAFQRERSAPARF